MTLLFRTKLGYGVGHVLNDLCSAMWFTYLLIYFHKVLLFNNTMAGVILLLGQVADALATPFVGIEADRTDDTKFCKKYGRKKTWHLVGTLLVLVCYPFVFSGCLGCEGSTNLAQVIYYAPFLIIFQFGWAAVQISHLSLIPSITQDPNDRTELNAIRYGFTVMSNITVYTITWVVLGIGSAQNALVGPEDQVKFMLIVFLLLGIGLVFSVMFHALVRETSSPGYHAMDQSRIDINGDLFASGPLLENNCHGSYIRKSWKTWLSDIQFYKVAVLYMGTRLYCNLSQAYIPIYLQDTLALPEESVAYIPLVMYIAGFFVTTAMRPLNKYFGRKITYTLGGLMGIGACVAIYFGQGDLYSDYLLYGVAALLGAGGSTMLVTSLSITADLIGPNVDSGAFVYGALSFTDKLSNGLAVLGIQYFNPCTTCCPKYEGYFREVLVFGCGSAAFMAILATLTLRTPSIALNTSTTDSSSETSPACSPIPAVADVPETMRADDVNTTESDCKRATPSTGSEIVAKNDQIPDSDVTEDADESREQYHKLII